MPARTPRTVTRVRSISMPPEWWDAIDAAAARDGLPVAAWLREAAADRLPKTARRRLPEPRRSGRPAADEAPANE